jgi:uncharacterized OB-fold protein
MSNPNRPTARCAACGWVVYADAEVCKHCQASRERLAASPAKPWPDGPRCPSCHGRVLATSQRCKHCGHELLTP